MTADGVELTGIMPSVNDKKIFKQGDIMISKSRHVIAVPNLEKSANYYRSVLGFKIHEIGDPGWRLFVKDACVIMAGECPDAMPPLELGDHSYFAHMDVEDIDNYHARIAAAGAIIIKPLRDEPWGRREFAVRTLDGHRIMFGLDIRDTGPGS
jgi:catechol 2,3-dioxygenase-like lactoylglutathione lyase family enzyme